MSPWAPRLEMAAWLILATVGSRALTPRAALRATSTLAELITPSHETRPDPALAVAAHALAAAISRRLPASNCLDEAIAARLWLARRGLPADVVVGMRRADGGGWDGHAWFERGGVPYGAGPLSHRVVFRESDLS